MNSKELSNSLKITDSLEDNIKALKEIFNNDTNIIFRNIENRHYSDFKACIMFMDNMVNQASIASNIILPLVEYEYFNFLNSNTLSEIQSKIIISPSVAICNEAIKVVASILSGDSVLLIDGFSKFIIIDTREFKTRNISEPVSENVVRGPREGFTEYLSTNVSLLRRRIKDPNFKVVPRVLGRVTQTNICICYIENIALPEIVSELSHRLDAIDIDGIIDSQYIEEYIKDSPFSIFKTIGNTERPDIVASKLLEGRIAILCDGSPFALMLPYIFIEYLQSNEDYYNNYAFATFNRFLRIFSFVLTSSVPALYVALVTYHQELIPTPLILNIGASHESVPFPTSLEAFLMLLGFDILREAGVRLPKPTGQAVSIIGALVLGQAAVEARLVSSPMIIVVALTGICSFLVPKMLGSIIIVRFIFLLLASILGLYGYIFGVIGLSIYLNSLKSFGIPYMLATYDVTSKNFKDAALRMPIWTRKLRPLLISQRNKKRQTLKKGGRKPNEKP
ncbi:spore germination protein [Desnuesiella massiliensis]|uniref:spore germination protein n=1 Tax=Desnuesiella massiliensis TaxID=1650662 RepID=UPI000AF23B0C|nr:spore germination protein [Desnuesiella massiliensis]